MKRHRFKKSSRSKVSNGSSFFLTEANGRTAEARFFRDLLDGFIEDLGGKENISNAKMDLCRAAAGLGLLANKMQRALVAGDPSFDERAYVDVADRQMRILSRLKLAGYAEQEPPSDESEDAPLTLEQIAATAHENDGENRRCEREDPPLNTEEVRRRKLRNQFGTWPPMTWPNDSPETETTERHRFERDAEQRPEQKPAPTSLERLAEQAEAHGSWRSI